MLSLRQGLLRQALDHARSGRGQVVALVGEAGVGKSRVAWEITRSHRTRDWLVLESSAASHDKATTWLPVIDLLRVYAVPLLEQAVAQSAALNLMAGHALRLTWLGESLLSAGELNRASEQSGQALTLADRLGERGSQPYARRLAGEIRMLQETPDLQAAATAYRDALRLATELEMHPLVARCRLGLAAVHRQAGAVVEARTDQDAAVEALRAMQMTHWLGRVETLGAAPR